MLLFSQRKGLRPVQKSIQRESIDDELRNRLLSALKIAVWDHWSPRDWSGYQEEAARKVEFLVRLFWLHYFKLPIDTLPAFDDGSSQSGYQVLRRYFFEAEQALIKLYGYTSDEGGIRHALSEEASNLSYVDAKF